MVWSNAIVFFAGMWLRGQNNTNGAVAGNCGAIQGTAPQLIGAVALARIRSPAVSISTRVKRCENDVTPNHTRNSRSGPGRIEHHGEGDPPFTLAHWKAVSD